MDWSCKRPASVHPSQQMAACNRENPGQDSVLWSQLRAFQTPPFTQYTSQCNNDGRQSPISILSKLLHCINFKALFLTVFRLVFWSTVFLNFIFIYLLIFILTSYGWLSWLFISQLWIACWIVRLVIYHNVASKKNSVGIGTECVWNLFCESRIKLPACKGVIWGGTLA